MSVDKLIVTNRARLRAKYGTSGADEVESALMKLIDADSKRGFDSKLVYLDLKSNMKPLGASRVESAASSSQNKRAIDDLCQALSPQYVLIVGAADVVPHQNLRNPLGGPGGDDDGNVPSDLPYACDADYSREIDDFLGPSRVVGRLPDIAGAEEPAYLLGVIAKAIKWKSRAKSQYKKGMVVSADVWKKSTRMSANKLFGSSARVRKSPKEGPKWPKSALARRVHFINCHGATGDSAFYGESRAGDYPVAHNAPLVKGIRAGSIVALECCYGAELYDARRLDIHPGIANTYLAKSACGVFGSTNIAYGPAVGNGAADLICLYFVRRVQSGASLGRAALEARQEFIRKNSPMSPVDLKTVGQFILLGDPSIHPVQLSSKKPKSKPKKSKTAKSVAGAASTPVRKRKGRRRRLRRAGTKLNRETGRTRSQPDRMTKADQARRPQAKVARLDVLSALLSSASIESSAIRSYDVTLPSPDLVAMSKQKGPAARKARPAAKSAAGKLATYHVMIESKPKAAVVKKTKKGDVKQIATRRVLLGLEEGGKLAETIEYLPK